MLSPSCLFKSETISFIRSFPEVCKTRKFEDVLFLFMQKMTEKWRKVVSSPSLRKATTQSLKTRGIAVFAIAAHVYNDLILNRIRPEVEKIHRKNQNGFRSGLGFH